MPWKDDEDRKAYDRRRYADNVAFVRQHKLRLGCADCGYNQHHAGLEFDHIKPRIRGTVGAQVGKNRNVLLEEIAQCEVVCGTCHGIRTFERNQAPLE